MATEEELTKLRLDPKREQYEARQRAERYAQESNEDIIKLNLDQDRNDYQAKQGIQNVVEEGKSYKSPSHFKYGILFALAVIVDIIDFAELTGIGWFIAKIVSVLATVIILAIFLTTGGRQKSASQYRKKLEDYINTAIKNVAHAERMIMRAGKIARYLPFLSGVVKFILAALANLFPILDLFPWMVIGVWLSYRDEKNTYNNARETAVALESEL